MEYLSQKIDAPSNLSIFMQGPPVEKGPLPAFFYFALSGTESLELDPFNQPIIFLKDTPIRCFSFTLPFHGKHFDNKTAMTLWAQEFHQNPQFFNNFLSQCIENISYLNEMNLLKKDKLAVGGLSRGGFIATHLAARCKQLTHLVAFAPLTTLSVLEEMKDLAGTYDLIHICDQLIHSKIRFYIGNRDIRVGTKSCFDFIENTTEIFYLNGKRSPDVELIISPSQGYKGHGTLPPTFKDGANWLIDQLLD